MFYCMFYFTCDRSLRSCFVRELWIRLIYLDTVRDGTDTGGGGRQDRRSTVTLRTERRASVWTLTVSTPYIYAVDHSCV